MITVSKGLSPPVLAQGWMNDLGGTPRYEHKSGIFIPRYANSGKDCGSAKHGTIRVINISQNDKTEQSDTFMNK